MKPFLIISSRDDDAVAIPEFESYVKFTGLSESDLVWHRAERESLAGVNPEMFSAIILAGSPFTVSAPEEQKSATELRVERELRDLLDQVVANDLPFLGVCYGIGTVGAHQGALVDGTYGEAVGATRVTLTEAGVDDPLFSQLPREFDAFVGHKEAITKAPDHLTVLASSPTAPVQAFRVGQNVYAIQYHPELDVESLSGRIRAYAHHGYFPPETTDSLLEEISAAHVADSHALLRLFVERYS